MGCCHSVKHIEYNETIKFIPPIKKAYVIKVYDGDTFTIAVTFPWNKKQAYRFPVRINGIDCPELKTKNANEKFVALKAKEFVTNLILHKEVILENTKYEKYGRLCADVYYKKNNIGELLLQKKLAVVYNGGTKKCPKNWKIYNKK